MLQSMGSQRAEHNLVSEQTAPYFVLSSYIISAL